MLKGLYKDSKRMQIKTSLCCSQGAPKGMVGEDGTIGENCKACGNYEQELDRYGFCNDDDCRRKRLIEALTKGEAVRTPEGLIIWTPGVKIAG